MKLFTSIALLGSLTLSSFAQSDKYSFNLDDPKQVKKQLTIFAQAMHDGDTATEFAFRTDYATNWRYKSMIAMPEFVGPHESLTEMGHLDKIKFGDLHIDTENRMIMRTHYTEPGNKKNKHRYAFHIDMDGKIDQVLYVPPITPEYFPEWEEDDFRSLISKLDTATTYTDEIEPDMYEFEAWSCGGVMPRVEELIVRELELSDEEVEKRKQLAENNGEEIMESEDEKTPLNEVPQKNVRGKLNY